MISRRAVVTSAAALAALAVLGLQEATLPSPGPDAQVLSPAEAHLVACLGVALFPVGNPLGVSGADVDLPAAVDELLGNTLDHEIQLVFRYFLRALDQGTRVARGMGFGSLPEAARREVLATWSDNAVLPRRMMHDLFRLVMGMAFFNEPAVVAAVGWRAECSVGSA